LVPALTPLTVEVKRLTANKKLRRLKRLDCWKKLIVELPARQGKSHMLFDLLGIIESTGP